MTEPDDKPGTPSRRGRSKEKKIPFSSRLPPRMHERLAHVAIINGRSVTQQHEILLDHALFREVDDLAPAAPSASRAALEKGLDHNAEVTGRIEALLLRRIAEIEAKAAADTTQLTTAIGHLQTLTAHVLAALQKIDAIDRSRREATDAPPRPRLVPAAG